jgi:hypothetical protein
MKLNSEIVPSEGIGGVMLGDFVRDVVERYSGEYNVKMLNDSSCSFDEGLLTIYFDPDGKITSISCNASFNGVYKDKLWSGMSVKDVVKNTNKQVAWTGFVQVDGINGIGLSLPDDLDDFDEITDHLSMDHVFDELWVYK